jgi:hypothetical protein
VRTRAGINLDLSAPGEDSHVAGVVHSTISSLFRMESFNVCWSQAALIPNAVHNLFVSVTDWTSDTAGVVRLRCRCFRGVACVMCRLLVTCRSTWQLDQVCQHDAAVNMETVQCVGALSWWA